ncbi:double-strand break repair helicase AddA [Erythrobacter litoralis]|uniref:DNA 3'-5' helicase n=1 Tax=Erythrobacter litoralis (strain HTCC2594) TaxID=314225 RepID=Q2NB35_ERYLH|nr:double-strand break repair helicase AddA [Erythrobacter litoralis]ABC63106.1 ATP-dependent exoDNAse beta subunit [Erythrobacter litoralis HTCC2594]
MSRKQLVFPLEGNQAAAVDPRDSVWLSASAGTGKTQVLSARVLRLLLQKHCEPESLLCLTFTKAGAAEMATRVNDVLASWVRMKDGDLAADLKAIGAPIDDATRARARTLFAKVLDCPGGGLRIDTIHAFSQWLLAAFPEESDLVPGTRAMEDRERELLAREVLSELLLAAEEDDLDALAMLSIKHGPDGAKSWLMRCADALDLWTGSDGWQPPMRERVLRLLGLPSDYGEDDVAVLCSDDAFAMPELRHCIATLEDWGTKGAVEAVEAVRDWMAGDAKARLAGIGVFNGTLFTATGEKPKNLHHIAKRDEGYEAQALAVLDAVNAVHEKMGLLALAEYLVPALTLGRNFALAWDDRKRREGLIDFDDQIRRASQLLKNSALADWIRYKLDRQFDHILVDEAQDTNQAQWDIIRALTGDFFTGFGQREDKLRTIFVVGDYKQAIFGFQGTSPQNFAAQKEIYRREIDAAIANAEALARDTRSKPVVDLRALQDLGLDRSYRTAQPVLDFVDHAIEAIGHTSIGLEREADRHEGDTRPGYVALWEPVVAGAEDDGEPSEEGWLPGPERAMADRIADQVREWLDKGHPLAKGTKRNAGPGDIMVLVRKRRELAGLIVARLHARGVPVAGVDRLRLGAPLAVKDLMAALRFAAQPLDDLSLANLLVSPLGGWSQEDLLEHGYRPDKVRLWDHLRKSEHPFVVETVERLRQLLQRVDYELPEALLHWILTGPWRGRAKLVARLGREANDPIDELVNAAFAYSATDTASVQGFIQWFDAGEGELKREPGGDDGLVRVMTVHGSKGLQAPIVILADATGNPDASRTGGLELQEDTSGKSVPIPALPKDEKHGPVAEAEQAAKAAEREEHWRLLYVAMTRAEEALYVGGALGQRELKKGPAEDSWYARLEPLFLDDALADPIWGARRERGALPEPIVSSGDVDPPAQINLPDWATQPIGPEPKPPRPLAPSSAGEEQGASPPLPPEIAAQAARRGVLMHSLLERLPDVTPAEREVRARAWLAQQAPEIADDERDEMLCRALAVLDEPGFAPIFAPDALAEVPLAAVVAGQVIAGTADRLLVTDDEVLVVDFKTARRPPAAIEDIPASIIRQMAAYVAALESIYPDKNVRAGVLYTQTPQLFALPAATLAPHKEALQG